MSVVNPIPIQLDEKAGLKYSAWGLKRFEEVTGKSLLKAEVELANPSMGDLIDLFWAGLLWDENKPEPDRKHIGCILFDYYTPLQVRQLISDAFAISFPEKSPDDGSPKASPQNGSNSGQ